MASGTEVNEGRTERGHGRVAAVRERISGCWQRLHPRPAGRRGAAIGIVLATGIVAGVSAAALRPGFGFLDLPAGILVGLLVAGLAGLATVLGLRLLAVVPTFVTWLGFGGLGALVTLLVLIGMPLPMAILIGIGLGLTEALLGGALALLLRGGLRQAARPARVLALLVLVVGTGVNAFVVWWLAAPGWNDHLVKAPVDTAQLAPITTPDPGLAGPYRVRTLTYGSGADRHRPEFGAGAALKTEPVDASPFVKGNEGFKAKARAWYWGFDFKHFPRNGRVWYPQGDGPFPLVLIVHGNHKMEVYSDPGYAYLAEHLASRGFIAVSVDENFFNGSWAGGLEKENDGRAWMLLQHLKLWQGWNRAKGNPFSGKVDMGNFALVGHSRGGEAAAIAGAFNRLTFYPDDATVPFSFGFSIKAIVAIAPSDGQYSPAGQPTTLANVDYLLLQGGHDADVSIFMGARQFRRVRFDDGLYHFKASVYAYRANHGQFNTVWGSTDFGWPGLLFLNRRPLLTGDEQRRLGRVTITAFLEASLKGKTAYAELFRDLRRARAWLPEDIYVTRFTDSNTHVLADFEEDVDVTTASAPGAIIEGHKLTVWREQRLPFRKGESRENGVVYLGWRKEADRKTADDPAWYAITLPQVLATQCPVTAGSLLTFGLAQADEDVPPPDVPNDTPPKQPPAERKTQEPKKDKGKPRPAVDLTVELVDAGGTATRLPLSRFRALASPLAARFTKLSGEADLYGKRAEPVLQTFELPVSAFVAVSPGFDPAKLKVIRLVFDRAPEGVVILDDVGIVVPGTTILQISR
jgi:dienelactone hydrolase